MSSNRRVVCIEDEPAMIELIRLILSRRGYEVIGAVGGREGLEAIQRDKPDAVLLDLMMPEMDGWEVYQKMKANEAMRHIPVIVVTAKAQSIDKVLGLHIAKVDDYITKPFGPQDLIDSLDKVLAARQSPTAEAEGETPKPAAEPPSSGDHMIDKLKDVLGE